LQCAGYFYGFDVIQIKKDTILKKNAYLRRKTDFKYKMISKFIMNSNVYENKPEEDQPTLEEIAGLYLFTPDELSVYLDWKAASKNESLSKNQKQSKRDKAVEKLRNVIKKRMPMAEKSVLEANIQAETDRKSQENIQLIEKALHICTPKQREDYYVLLAGATDPKKSDAKQKQCTKNAMKKLRLIIAKQAEKEKRASMTPEELAVYENDPERVAAKAENARYNNESSAKHNEKEAALRRAGDPDALARQVATIEANRKWHAAANLRKREEEAKNAKIFPNSVRNSTVLGVGDERHEKITRTVEEIMGSHAGSALGPTGKPTSKKWVNDHGDVSVGGKLAEGEYAAYLGITRTTVHPGKEEKCAETTYFLTQIQRDPLWRMLQKDGDLKRMSPKQAKSVVNVYLLARYENPYDVTSIEGACQFYLENELGLPHGICLHRRAGAGNRLKDSMTDDEYKLFRSGKIKGWSLNLTMIRTTDRVFADFDPFDPERSPPLVSASVPTHDGTGTVYNIMVRGNKQRFPDTPSVLADMETNRLRREGSKARKKARRQNRKRNAAESVDSAESPEEVEEETAKKRKI
jgi:hypothetical protein